MSDKDTIAELEQKNKELTDLCTDLLVGADLCSKEPLYLVQPFFSIVKKHMSVIQKYVLM